MKSTVGKYNQIISSIKSKEDLDSIISTTNNKIQNLKKAKAKELKSCIMLDQKIQVLNKYKNDIMYYDDLCYTLKLNYYEILNQVEKSK